MTKDNIKLNNNLKEAIIRTLEGSNLTISGELLEIEAIQVYKRLDDGGGRGDSCRINGTYSQGMSEDLRDKLKKEIEKKDYIAIHKNYEKGNFICETKNIKTEGPNEELEKNGIKDSEYFLILACLDEKIMYYRGIIQFILKNFLKEVKHYSDYEDLEVGSERFKFFFGGIQKKRILFGDYVEFYLQEKGLPDAEILTELSAEKYEGSDSEARIYFDLHAVNEACVLDEKAEETRVICSGKLRLIRKLMEIAKKDRLYLYAEKKEAQEFIVTKLVEKNKNRRKGKYVKFMGFMHWCVVCNGKEEVTYYHGQYLLNASEKDTLHSAKIKMILSGLQDQWKTKIGICYAEENWNKLVEILKKQKHGTSVILTDSIEYVDALCDKNRGIRLSKCEGFCWDENRGWNEERILSVTAIDGALFMDLKGNALAIGVLVDGLATVPGNVGRGARYNSIVNYVMQKEKGLYIAIIVSEDGMVDIVCNRIKEEMSSKV